MVLYCHQVVKSLNSTHITICMLYWYNMHFRITCIEELLVCSKMGKKKIKVLYTHRQKHQHFSSSNTEKEDLIKNNYKLHAPGADSRDTYEAYISESLFPHICHREANNNHNLGTPQPLVTVCASCQEETSGKDQLTRRWQGLNGWIKGLVL